MLGQAGAAACRTLHLRDSPLDELTGRFLEAFFLLAQKRPLELGDEALVGGVEPEVLDFLLLAVEKRMALLRREPTDWDVRGVFAGFGVGAQLPGTGLEAGGEDGAVVKRKRVVDDLRLVELRGASRTRARRAHPAGAGVVLAHRLLARGIRQHAATGHAWHIE